MWLGGGIITRPVPRLSEGRPRPYTQLALWMTQLGLEVAAEKGEQKMETELVDAVSFL